MVNYDIAEHWEDLSPGKRAQVLNLASKEQLKKWASDPNCNQMLLCGAALAGNVTSSQLATTQGLVEKGPGGSTPAPLLTELSEDARYIGGLITKQAAARMNLRQELESLSIGDLVFFLWKFWWAALLAGLIPAFVILILAAVVMQLSK